MYRLSLSYDRTCPKCLITASVAAAWDPVSVTSSGNTSTSESDRLPLPKYSNELGWTGLIKWTGVRLNPRGRSTNCRKRDCVQKLTGSHFLRVIFTWRSTWRRNRYCHRRSYVRPTVRLYNGMYHDRIKWFVWKVRKRTISFRSSLFCTQWPNSLRITGKFQNFGSSKSIRWGGNSIYYREVPCDLKANS